MTFERFGPRFPDPSQEGIRRLPSDFPNKIQVETPTRAWRKLL